MTRRTTASNIAFFGTEPVTVYLHGSRNGVDLPGSPLSMVFNAPSSVVGIDREELNDTANFQLPDSWPRGTVTFRARARKANRLSIEVVSSPITLAFTPKETPTIWVVPINNGSASTPNLPSNAVITGNQSYLEAVYPVPDVDFVAKPWQDLGVVTASDPMPNLNSYYDSAVLAWLFGLIFTGQSPFDLPDQIYGVTPTGGGLSDPVWAGSGRGKVAWGFIGSSQEGTMAHEINHNLDTNAAGTWGRHVANPNCTHSNVAATAPPPAPPAGCTWHFHGSNNTNRLHDNNWGCGATGPDPNYSGNASQTDSIGEVGFDTSGPTSLK